MHPSYQNSKNDILYIVHHMTDYVTTYIAFFQISVWQILKQQHCAAILA